MSDLVQRPRLWEALTGDRPASGVDYSRMLATGDAAAPARAFAGAMGAVLGFMVVTSLVMQGLMWVLWQIAGRPGDFASFYRFEASYEDVWGMVAVHLGLATLIPISLAMLVLVHHRRPRWIVSVVGRVRWRYLGVCMGAGTLVIVGLWALSRLGESWAVQPQPGFIAFVAAIVLTSPLQAVAEEVFFRGYLVQAFGTMVNNRWFAIVTPAVIFAFFHGTQNGWLFANRLAFGLLAGYLVVRTGGLEAGIAAHVVNNVAAFITAGLFSTIAQVRATQQIGLVQAAWDIGSFAVFALVAIIIARRMQVATVTPGSDSV